MSTEQFQKAAAIIADSMADATDGYVAESANYNVVTRYLLSGKEVNTNLLNAVANLRTAQRLAETDLLRDTLEALINGLGDRAAAHRRPARVKILSDAKETFKDLNGSSMKEQEEKDRGGWFAKLKRKRQKAPDSDSSEDSRE